MTVLEVDAFGTAVVALDEQVPHLPSLPRIGESGVVRTPLGARHELRVGTTFADVPAGALVLYLDSDGALALARRDGSAAHLLHVRPGDTLTIVLDDDADLNEPEVA